MNAEPGRCDLGIQVVHADLHRSDERRNHAGNSVIARDLGTKLWLHGYLARAPEVLGSLMEQAGWNVDHRQPEICVPRRWPSMRRNLTDAMDQDRAGAMLVTTPMLVDQDVARIPASQRHAETGILRRGT
jgi:hypothetical protein